MDCDDEHRNDFIAGCTQILAEEIGDGPQRATEEKPERDEWNGEECAMREEHVH
jgi:hypothetical protein